MRRLRSFPVRARLTVFYVVSLATLLLVSIAATSCVLYLQLKEQLGRFEIEDIETVEGLLYFDGGRLLFNDSYHNHPESRLVLERLVEVLSLHGKILYRNDRLGQNLLGGQLFLGEGVNSYSPRSMRLQDGRRVLVVSRRHEIYGFPVVIRLGYDESSISSRIKDFLVASLTTLPALLAFAGFLSYRLAKRSLRPVEMMAQRAEHITADHLDHRLPIENEADEMGHLARVFNGVLDRLQYSFDQLRRFTSDASHELRTPLTAIRSVGEVSLQKRRTPEQYQETIGSMLEEVGRLTKLVENLLTISRADSGHLQPNIGEFSIHELLYEAVGTVEVLAEERHQTIQVSSQADVVIRADRVLLRQALLNVLDNAVKYSPIRGAIIVTVDNGVSGRIIVRISDSGPGIPNEHASRIFDRFYRVDDSRTRGTGGTGLGLAIAQWAVAVQGGQIRLENSHDGGATFSIELPVAGQGTPVSADLVQT